MAFGKSLVEAFMKKKEKKPEAQTQEVQVTMGGKTETKRIPKSKKSLYE